MPEVSEKQVNASSSPKRWEVLRIATIVFDIFIVSVMFATLVRSLTQGYGSLLEVLCIPAGVAIIPAAIWFRRARGVLVVPIAVSLVMLIVGGGIAGMGGAGISLIETVQIFLLPLFALIAHTTLLLRKELWK